MSRITSKSGEGAPRIDRQSVEKFFEERASKAEQLGHVQAVIYQDKNPELARQRDAAEKAKLLPMLKLSNKESVLDVGCGTGRWADEIVPQCAYYLGVDFSAGLVDIATKRFESVPHAHFACLPAEKVSIENIGRHFDVILSLGLFIYLNDDELAQTLKGYASVAGSGCRLIMREPVGTVDRLTILEHFSEDMDQVYNAIYRTEAELMGMIEKELLPAGFRLSSSGDVYASTLNNRADTKQRWLLLEKQ